MSIACFQILDSQLLLTVRCAAPGSDQRHHRPSTPLVSPQRITSHLAIDHRRSWARDSSLTPPSICSPQVREDDRVSPELQHTAPPAPLMHDAPRTRLCRCCPCPRAAPRLASQQSGKSGAPTTTPTLPARRDPCRTPNVSARCGSWTGASGEGLDFAHSLGVTA